MSPRNGLIFCGLFVSLRFFLYAYLPRGHVDLVLPIEFFHGGVSSGLMAASVKVLGKDASQENTMAVSQAMLSATMFNVSGLIGGGMFSYLTTRYPFEPLYLIFGTIIAVFSILWGVLGHYIRVARRDQRRENMQRQRSSGPGSPASPLTVAAIRERVSNQSPERRREPEAPSQASTPPSEPATPLLPRLNPVFPRDQGR